MRLNLSLTKLGAAITASLLLGSELSSLAAPPEKPASREVTAKDLLKPADKPLDARIKAEKITEADLPPLPNRVAVPLPPVHNISTTAAEVPIDPALWKKANEAIQNGLNFLRTKQDARGGWMADAKAAPTDQPSRPTPVTMAATALAVKAFVQADPKAVKDPAVRKAISLVTNSRSADGSFDNSAMSNYVMAAIVSGLAGVQDQDPEFHNFVAEGVQWLQVNQWDQSEGLNPRQDWFGGAGYGNGARPDLSNTQMMLDALYEAGLSPDEPAFQKALAFVSRTQNLKITNKSAWTGNDGGFVYTPANGGESMGSEAAGEGRYGEKITDGSPRSLRSYGSMTYAGFKSMLYAGLSTDDVRVRTAFDWIRNNWTFDENPGLGKQGLYYYYHTIARALFVAQQNEITDSKGVKHNWREELINALISRQSADGSWINKDKERWMENDPVLVTIYATLALQEALKPVIRTP